MSECVGRWVVWVEDVSGCGYVDKGHVCVHVYLIAVMIKERALPKMVCLLARTFSDLFYCHVY